MTLTSRLVPCTTVLAFAACATPFPVEPGKVLVVEPCRRPIAAGEPGYDTTLQVRWLGTACFRIQLGPLSVVTDPFVSPQGLLRVGLGGTLRSDEGALERAFACQPPADGVFVAHSHYDHLLDAAPLLGLPGWEDVPLYGSVTTRNILHGYGHHVAAHWRRAETDGCWHTVVERADGGSIEYMAMQAKHAPQFGPILLYPGDVEDPRTTPPETAGDFQLGGTYAFLLRLRHAGACFTVFVMTSASDCPSGGPPASVADVDVAILCAASWTKASEYPGWVLDRLQPRDVVCCHYDDFFQTDPTGPRHGVPFLDFDAWLRGLQRSACYPRFRRIWVPDVDCTIGIVE